MSSGRLLPIGLFLVLSTAVPTLAHASPPDPSWIPGIYDDGDFDDVVILVVAATGNTPPDVPIELRFIPRWVETLAFSEARPDAPCAVADPSRAPPAS